MKPTMHRDERSRRRGLMAVAGLAMAILAETCSVGLVGLSGWFIAASAVAGAGAYSAFSYLAPSGGVRGATVTALRDAVYFPANQHARPIAVLATWAAALFVAMLLVSHRLRRSPGDHWSADESGVGLGQPVTGARPDRGGGGHTEPTSASRHARQERRDDPRRRRQRSLSEMVGTIRTDAASKARCEEHDADLRQ
jgi:hypothetical protein